MIDRDSVLRILTEFGFDNSGENPHSWRCKWYAETAEKNPDLETYCTCPQDLADAIMELEIEHE